MLSVRKVEREAERGGDLVLGPFSLNGRPLNFRRGDQPRARVYLLRIKAGFEVSRRLRNSTRVHQNAKPLVSVNLYSPEQRLSDAGLWLRRFTPPGFLFWFTL